MIALGPVWSKEKSKRLVGILGLWQNLGHAHYYSTLNKSELFIQLHPSLKKVTFYFMEQECIAPKMSKIYLWIYHVMYKFSTNLELQMCENSNILITFFYETQPEETL